tara:strand:- start:1899 stop:2375 length:477 start_codon:yes stop_codon:yes gene_type:complete
MSAYGFDPSQKDATAMFVPGTIKEEPATGSTASTFEDSGPRRWRYVKAGASLSTGVPCRLDDADVAYTDVLSSAASKVASLIAGIPQQDFTSGEYGWVLCFGLGTVKDSGSGIASGAAFAAASGGVATAGGAADNETLGHVTAILGASATGLAFIRCE